MNNITDKARELRNAYQREYRRKNPDKIRQHNVNYWEKRAANYTPEIRAREMYTQGFTQRQIAEALNVSLGTVNKYLNKK